MGLEQFDRWGAAPARLEYQSRFHPQVSRRPRPTMDPVAAAVRVTAATVVLGCLTVAVPCLVFAGVGLWFDDGSAVESAWVAADCGLAAAVAAVPAVVCHRRLARRCAPWPIGTWN